MKRWKEGEWIDRYKAGRKVNRWIDEKMDRYKAGRKVNRWIDEQMEGR